MMRLNLLFILCMVLSSAQDDKCVMVGTWDGPISLINLPSMTGSIIGNQNQINSFAPDEGNNIVYGLAWNGDLYAFDICDDGSKTLVKAGVLNNVWGLAYNPNTELFYAVQSWDTLYTIDPNNNYAATFEIALSHPFESLVFNRAFTKMYAYTNIGPNEGVYTIDVPSYTITQVAPILAAGSLSIEWENENDELKMLLPSRYSLTPQFWSLDVAAGSYSVIGNIPAQFASLQEIRGITVFYDNCDAICNQCKDYIYAEPGGCISWSQARTYCQETHGTELATIVTQEQLDCALGVINDASGSSPWIGLNSIDSNGVDFKYLDGSLCPVANNGVYGQCIPSELWRYKGKDGNEAGRPRCPHGTENGAKCARIVPDPDGLIDNDIKCDDQYQITAILCNAPPSN